MILKKDNVEKIVGDEVIASMMISKGWKEIVHKSEKENEQPLEKPKKSRKKSEGAN